MLTALFLGTGLAFISAAPVAGPVSAMIFTLGMKGKQAKGRWVALGAGVVEGAYAFLALWGFTAFMQKLSYIEVLSKILAALILGALGFHFFRSKKMRKPAALSNQADEYHNAPKAFAIGAGLSAVNISLIATWTAAITTLYSMNLFQFSKLNSLLFSLGVTVGIYVWFSVMLSILVKHRSQLKPGMLDKGLKGMGIFLLGLCVWIVYRLVTEHLFNA
ncbi:MAG: LysE family transporter [Bdellovibrionales bacterium]|nr:LysE family transporter [Oligoflexia bacterium]